MDGGQPLRAALFDMDRTLVRVDTVRLYHRYQRQIGEATRADGLRLAYWFSLYTLGILDVPGVAARVLAQLRGVPETALAARCDDWFRRHVEPHVTDDGRRAVERHLARGEVVAIVTGASPYVARPLARRLGIDHVLASDLEVDARGVFTGRFIDPLCYAHGKVLRARGLADKLGFALAESTFYSDSCTDLPLLEAVLTPVVVNPDLRLRWIARRRGWPIEAW